MTAQLDFHSAASTLLCVATQQNQPMNVLSKVKSDKRVVEVKEAVDSGEAIDRASAKVASGLLKPHDPTLDIGRNS